MEGVGKFLVADDQTRDLSVGSFQKRVDEIPPRSVGVLDVSQVALASSQKKRSDGFHDELCGHLKKIRGGCDFFHTQIEKVQMAEQSEQQLQQEKEILQSRQKDVSKKLEAIVLGFAQNLNEQGADGRWVSIGTTHIQQAFMAYRRAIFNDSVKPDTTSPLLDYDEEE